MGYEAAPTPDVRVTVTAAAGRPIRPAVRHGVSEAIRRTVLWMPLRDPSREFGVEGLKLGRYCRSPAAQRNHVAYRAARHRAGDGSPQSGPSHGVAVSPAPERASRPARPRLRKAPARRVRSRLFLAPARRLCELHHAEDPAGILAAEIPRQCRTRPPRLRGTGTPGMANSYYLGVRSRERSASEFDLSAAFDTHAVDRHEKLAS